MTISYTGDVANASSFGCFNKILFKWKGSVYKLIYKEMIAYIGLYFLINLIYREVLVKNSQCEQCLKWKESREAFEALRTYCKDQLSSIPLTFVLGFYVSLIVNRWWKQYTLLPWPDSMAIYTVSLLIGKEERQRLMRRNIIRYVLLSYCMAMRTVSFRVKKRFPDLQHLVDAGLMREDELKVFHNLEGKVTANKWFLPLVWASDITARALEEGKIKVQTVKCLMDELVNIRNSLTGIMNHDWVSVPLVYTQVVTLAVYSYFVAALIGSQWIQPESDEAYRTAYNLPMGDSNTKLDLYYPFFLTVQFTFFFGWLKVAETLINPFGEDDDDFELNRLIDRHMQVGYLIVDHDDTPELLKDRYWDECIPQEIPYTIAAEKFKKEEFQGSAERTLSIKDTDKEYGYVYNVRRYGRSVSSTTPHSARAGQLDADTEHYEDGEYGDYESVGTPMVGTRLSYLLKKRLDSVRSKGSISSSSTYIYGPNGQNLSKKSHHKSSLSLYEKIRKMSVFDTHNRPEGRYRKSSRLSNISKDSLRFHRESASRQHSAQEEGEENPGFEEEEETGAEGEVEDFEEDPKFKKILETISENQNSPYSTQASHNPSRRMSVQSIFPDPDKRRGSRDYAGPVLELFHENEEEERARSRISWKEGRREQDTIIPPTTPTQSLSGSHRSRESGVGSMCGDTASEERSTHTGSSSRKSSGGERPEDAALPPFFTPALGRLPPAEATPPPTPPRLPPKHHLPFSFTPPHSGRVTPVSSGRVTPLVSGRATPIASGGRVAPLVNHRITTPGCGRVATVGGSYLSPQRGDPLTADVSGGGSPASTVRSSPSPLLPRRRAVMALNSIEDDAPAVTEHAHYIDHSLPTPQPSAGRFLYSAPRDEEQSHHVPPRQSNQIEDDEEEIFEEIGPGDSDRRQGIESPFQSTETVYV